MGKGDKKTRRGKIIMKSHGVSRPRKHRKTIQMVAEKTRPDIKPEKKKEEEVTVSTPPATEIKTAPRKTEKAVKKTTVKKPAAKKTKTPETKPKTQKTKKKEAKSE